jgi:hypothetical protein
MKKVKYRAGIDIAIILAPITVILYTVNIYKNLEPGFLKMKGLLVMMAVVLVLS